MALIRISVSNELVNWNCRLLEPPLTLIVWDPESSYYYFLTTTANSLEITSAKTVDGLRASPDRR